MFHKFLLVVLCVLFAAPQVFASDVLDYIPAEADLIIQSNIKELVALPEFQKALEDVIEKSDNASIKQMKNTGLDMLKDVNSVTIFLPLDAIMGAVSGNVPTESNIGLIINGKFNIDNIMNALKNNSEASKQLVFNVENGLNTLTYMNKETGNGKIIFMDNNTIIIGSELGVDNAKAVKFGKKASIKSKANFSKAVSVLNPKSVLAFTTELSSETKASFAQNEELKFLSKIMYVSVDLNLDEDVLPLNITGTFDKDTDMKAAGKWFEELSPKLSAVEAPYEAFDDFIKNYKSSVKGDSIVISSLVKKDSIKKIIENEGGPELPESETESEIEETEE